MFNPLLEANSHCCTKSRQAGYLLCSTPSKPPALPGHVDGEVAGPLVREGISESIPMSKIKNDA